MCPAVRSVLAGAGDVRASVRRTVLPGRRRGEILYLAATGPTVDHLSRIGKLPSPAPDFLRRVLAMDAAARYPSARVFAQNLTPSATMVKGQLAEMMRALFPP